MWSLPARTAAAVTGWFTRYLPTIHECPVLHVIVVLVSMQLVPHMVMAHAWLNPSTYSMCLLSCLLGHRLNTSCLWTRMNLHP